MVRTYPTPEAVVAAAADLVAGVAHEAVTARGRFLFCLAGGSTPKALFALLRERDDIDWPKTWITWGDERPVPADHPDSNVGAARETLLNHVPVPEAQIMAPDGSLPPAETARAYEQTLRGFFGDAPPRLDLVLLGLGPDAHTASLFPGTNALHEAERWVVAPYVEKLGTHRVTLTAPLINRAHHVAFVAYGANKAEAFRQVRAGPRDVNRYPAQLIDPTGGELHWLVDEATAGEA
ncbi:MAG: 6-phosphogluconolactonase [Catalinimonas sp.]